MSKHETVKTTAPVIWFPSKRAIRTAVQALVSAAATLAIVVTVAPQVLDAVSDVLPGSWVAWLSGGVAFLTALSAALSRVMAIPAVNTFLTKIGAGSLPASSVKALAAGVATSLTGDDSTVADTTVADTAGNTDGVLPDPVIETGS